MVVKFMDHTATAIEAFIKESKTKVAKPVAIDAVIQFFTESKNPRLYQFICERLFINSGRPFFNVYPKVLDCLAKTPIGITPSKIPRSEIHQLKSISVRLPIEGQIAKKIGSDYFLISLLSEDDIRAINKCGCKFRIEPSLAVMTIVKTDKYEELAFSIVPMNGSWEEFKWKDDIPDSDRMRLTSNFMCKIALGVMLLAADPDYIKPVLLKADEGKTTPIEERIARAKNRGVYGFTIGEEIERCPHFRRPHFAIRWTGKGAEIPKLVPVKGAVVGDKKLLTNVPTGFEDGPKIKP